MLDLDLKFSCRNAGCRNSITLTKSLGSDEEKRRFAQLSGLRVYDDGTFDCGVSLLSECWRQGSEIR